MAYVRNRIIPKYYLKRFHCCWIQITKEFGLSTMLITFRNLSPSHPFASMISGLKYVHSTQFLGFCKQLEVQKFDILDYQHQRSHIQYISFHTRKEGALQCTRSI